MRNIRVPRTVPSHKRSHQCHARRYVSGASEIVCHNNSLYVNGNRLRTDLCPRRSAMAANTAPGTPPHPTVRPLLRRNSSLSSVPETPSVDTAAPGSLPTNVLPPLPSFVCPIGHEIMRDPVIAADGFSYERHNLQRWLRRFPAPLRARSPCTNLVLPSHTVVPNHSLRAAIAEWAALRDGGGRGGTT